MALTILQHCMSEGSLPSNQGSETFLLLINFCYCTHERNILLFYVQRPIPKKNMVYGTLLCRSWLRNLALLCPWHSRVDSNTFTMGGQPYARVDLNPIPQSTLSPVRDLDFWHRMKVHKRGSSRAVSDGSQLILGNFSFQPSTLEEKKCLFPCEISYFDVISQNFFFAKMFIFAKKFAKIV
jgi:hypothetical protein